MNHSQASAGLYVHIPFCTSKCYYCDFVVKPLQPSAVAKFWTALDAEIERAAVHWRDVRFKTIFIGGGTPSSVPAAQLVAMLRRLQHFFSFVGGKEQLEVTLEANPETITPESLQLWRSAGVNRLSIGLQAWQDELLARLGRRHRRDDFIRAWQWARRAGFDNVNVDLMYGLPGQSPADWIETLERVVELQPEHISTYGLQIETGTAFDRWHRQGRLPVPEEDVQVEMQMEARDMLLRNGYRHYEIANFARPGFAARHNQGYWLHTPYLGLGPGAASFRDGMRWWNVRVLRHYVARALEQRLPIGGEETLQRDDLMLEYVMLRLRLLERGLSEAQFQRRFGLPLRMVFPGVVERLLEKQWLVEKQNRRDGEEGTTLVLTEKALPLANRVFGEFLR